MAEKSLEEVIAERDNLAAQLEAANAENAELKATKAVITKEIDGTYTSKKHKKTIKFKTGFIKTRVKGELVDSAVIIANKDGKYTDYLDNLINIGYGGIEVVSK